ncbi:MAG: AlpA family phage regulatory protein [Comamonas sp.]
MQNHASSMNLLRATQVCQKLQISKSTLYAKLDRSSKYYDPTFPKQIKLGLGSVGWVENQIDQWISARLFE